MATESVCFKKRCFDENNQIISNVQKFMELYLSEFNHPKWFKEILQNLHSDFNFPFQKTFFSEDVINNDQARLNYCIKMIDITKAKMESINKRLFYDFVKDAIKGTWCDISNSFYNEAWFIENESYKTYYIGLLVKLRHLMDGTEDENIYRIE